MSRVPAAVRDPADPSGNLTGVASVAAGWFFDLAVKSDGTGWGWGENGSGRVG